MLRVCSPVTIEERSLAKSHMILREKLKHYYEAIGLDERWIGRKIGNRFLKVFPVFILPKSFRDWMKIHDAHHLITGFDTDFRGEVEIAAWVLARNGLNFGSKPRWLPFFVIGDTFFLALIGLFFMPKRVLRAFNKGRGEHSLHRLNPGHVLEMEFEAAKHYVTTGSLS